MAFRRLKSVAFPRLLAATLLVQGVVFGSVLLARLGWYAHIRAGGAAPYFLYLHGSLLHHCIAALLGMGSAVLLWSWAASRRARCGGSEAPPGPVRPGLWLAGLLIGGFVLRLVAALNAGHAPPSGLCDQAFYYESAGHFLRGDLPLSFCSRGHVGLIWAPFVAGFGSTTLPIMLLHTVLNTATVYLAYRLLVCLDQCVVPALITAGMLAFSPTWIAFCADLWGEVAFTFLLFGALTALAGSVAALRRGVAPGGHWLAGFVVAGLLLGTSHWVRPLAHFYLCVALFWLGTLAVWRTRPSPRRLIGGGTAMAVAFLLSVAWLVYASGTLQGEYTPGYMEARGFNLLIGVLPLPRGTPARHPDLRVFEQAMAVFEAAGAPGSPAAQPDDQFGSKSTQDLARRLARRVVLDNPWGFLFRAVTEKLTCLWDAECQGEVLVPVGSSRRLFFGSLSYFFVVGAAVPLCFFLALQALRSGVVLPGLLLAATMLCACSALHLVVMAFPRYHFYVLPFLYATVAYGLSASVLPGHSSRGAPMAAVTTAP